MKTVLLLVVLSVLGSAVMLSLQAPKLEQTLDGLKELKKGGQLPAMNSPAQQRIQGEMSNCMEKCRNLSDEESQEDQMSCQRKCVSGLAEQIGLDKMMPGAVGMPPAAEGAQPAEKPRARAIPVE